VSGRFAFAHGFTQTANSWAIVMALLADALGGGEFVAVDLPGHGDAEPPDDADLWQSADRLVRAGGRATYVGYSMGGRVALHAALAHPADVEQLVLIGATAGIDDAGERRARLEADERLAARIESIGIDAFLDEWLANPLFAGLTPATAGLDDRRRNRPERLAASLRATGTGTQQPLWDRLGEIACPVLVLVGADDAKFTALGERLVRGLADGELAVIEGAGHSVHLEQPAATVDALARRLRR
jgi:2-succinyl-6-hydroxy-2,4-cyclohexadiene-1-carboxylate synthase